jgi:hypothetical protein
MALIPAKTTKGLSGRDVPEEDTAVAADGGEGCVVGGDGEVEDGIAVRGVGLDELGSFWGREGVCGWWGWGAGGVVEADGAVGGAG